MALSAVQQGREDGVKLSFAGSASRLVGDLSEIVEALEGLRERHEWQGGL